ncbi:hypothetical protein M758_3G201800 [Ceratodon purpureus]|nr:hypothetical protein M758_3G201800 [Ceratodon purpureus]
MFTVLLITSCLSIQHAFPSLHYMFTLHLTTGPQRPLFLCTQDLKIHSVVKQKTDRSVEYCRCSSTTSLI